MSVGAAVFYPGGQFVEKFFVESICKLCRRFLFCCTITQNRIVLTVHKEFFVSLALVLKNHYNFKYFVDFAGLDLLVEPRRGLFLVLRRLLNPSVQSQFLEVWVKVFTKTSSQVPSLSGLFSAGIWLEREIFDLYGTFFTEHGDLRRILTDYGFSGHPFLKDFPLSGYVEVRYDDSKNRVVCEPVELAQAFRFFDFANPWVPR